MIFFQSIKKFDKQVYELFKTCRKNFNLKLNRTAKKQLIWFIKKANSHFFKIYYDNEFIGCIFFIGKKGTSQFCAFSKRNTHLKNIETAKFICNIYKQKYSDEIVANTKSLAAKIALLRVGFKKQSDGSYTYG